MLAVYPYFKVDVDSAGCASLAHKGNNLTLSNPLALLSDKLAAVSIACHVTVVVLYLDIIAIAAVVPLRCDDKASVGGYYLLSIISGNIKTLVVGRAYVN